MVTRDQIAIFNYVAKYEKQGVLFTIIIYSFIIKADVRNFYTH